MINKNKPLSRDSNEFRSYIRSPRPLDYKRLLATCAVRPLRNEEQLLILALMRNATFGEEFATSAPLDAARVRDMPGEVAGSIHFESSRGEIARNLDRVVGELWYVDADGVPATFCLSVDNRGELYEMEGWKIDNSALKKFPTPEDLLIERPGC